jgi:hypothetical protein
MFFAGKDEFAINESRDIDEKRGRAGFEKLVGRVRKFEHGGSVGLRGKLLGMWRLVESPTHFPLPFIHSFYPAGVEGKRGKE